MESDAVNRRGEGIFLDDYAKTNQTVDDFGCMGRQPIVTSNMQLGGESVLTRHAAGR
jgi:hypothetical protein